MAYTTPTYSAGSWLTENIADIRNVMEGVYDIHQDACPTLQIMMSNMKDVEVGPSLEFHTKIRHGLYDVRIAPNSKIRFATPDIDPYHQATWPVVRWYASAGTDDEEMTLYGRQNRSRIDLVQDKVDIVKQSIAHFMNYSIFSDWAETITDSEIDLETELSSNPVPPAMKIVNVTAHTNRPYSLPMFTRASVTGHTFANISSGNAYWATSYTDGTGSTVTRETSTTAANTDVVTSISGTEEFTVAKVREHLNKIQRGPGVELLAPMPADLYDVLEDYLLSERRRGANDSDNASPLYDLGINGVIRMVSRNCTFYSEPMMTDLWPNSVFFYSPDHWKLQLDPAFGPKIYDWERVPGTNMYAFGVVYLGNTCVPDGGSRRAMSGMHGYAAP